VKQSVATTEYSVVRSRKKPVGPSRKNPWCRHRICQKAKAYRNWSGG